MDTPVVFSYALWAARYPELANYGVGPTLAQLYFNEAQIYCDNSATSIVPNCAPAYQRQTFLNMLTAHIAALNASLVVAGQSQPSNPLVGRISQAAEGSVNLQVENQYPPGTPQWFQQTKYGAAFWAGSSAFRTMRYYAAYVPQAINTFSRGPGLP